MGFIRLPFTFCLHFFKPGRRNIDHLSGSLIVDAPAIQAVRRGIAQIKNLARRVNLLYSGALSFGGRSMKKYRHIAFDGASYNIFFADLSKGQAIRVLSPHLFFPVFFIFSLFLQSHIRKNAGNQILRQGCVQINVYRCFFKITVVIVFRGKQDAGRKDPSAD